MRDNYLRQATGPGFGRAHKERETMTTTIIKNREGFCQFLPVEVPYILICDEHGWTAACDSRLEAEDLAEWPTEWCEDCLHAEITESGI